MWGLFVMGLAAGLAATPHCLGMCGGFPLYLAKPSSRGSVSVRLVLFVIGKTFTYVFLGTLAASVGAILLKTTSLSLAKPYLPLAAGGLTVVFGLVMLGLRLPRIKALSGLAGGEPSGGMLRGLLANPGRLSAFVLGLGVGFLPCPLPMAMLLVAAGSHSVPLGMAVMAGVGIGTSPGLIAAGLFGAGLNRSLARVGMRAAGAIVLAIGLLTIGHAVMALMNAQAGAACCHPQ